MAATMLPPSIDTTRRVRCAPAIPVVHAEGTSTVVSLYGETDTSFEPVLCNVLSQVIASGGGDVVIDLTEVTFIDTGTVRVLANGYQLLDRQGRKLIFRSPSRLAFRLIGMFGLAGRIEISETIQQ
jgi:anti-sigma B factor antagonist